MDRGEEPNNLQSIIEDCLVDNPDDIVESNIVKVDCTKFVAAQEQKFEIARSTVIVVDEGKVEYDSATCWASSGTTFLYKGRYKATTNHVKQHVVIERICCVNLDFTKKYLRLAKHLCEFKKHDNTIQYYRCLYKKRELYNVIEYVDGNLQQWFNGEIDGMPSFSSSLNVISVNDVLSQITKGLQHLHNQNIIHGNLNPSNVVVCRRQGQFLIKVARFGPRRELVEGVSCMVIPTDKEPTRWNAPEVMRAVYPPTSAKCDKKRKLNDNNMSKGGDIFPLGLIYYWVLTGGHHPFGINKIYQRYNILYYLPQIDSNHFSSNHLGYLPLIKEMLAEYPDERPTVNAVLEHFLFWSDDKTCMFIREIQTYIGLSKDTKVDIKSVLENGYYRITNQRSSATRNWLCLLCPILKDYFKNIQKYDGDKVVDLYLAVGDLHEHYISLPENVKEALGLQKGFLTYWLTRFPYLIQFLWETIKSWKTGRVS